MPESGNKGAVLAAVLVLAGKHGQGQVAPLVRTQPLHGHQDSVTLTTMVSPRPGLILQHSIKQAVFTIHPVHQGARGIFGCFQSIQEQVGRVFSLLLREPHTHTSPTNKINIHHHCPQLSSSPFILPNSSAFPVKASSPASLAPPRGRAHPNAILMQWCWWRAPSGHRLLLSEKCEGRALPLLSIVHSLISHHTEKILIGTLLKLVQNRLGLWL